MSRTRNSMIVAFAAGLALAGGCCHVKPRDFAFVEAGNGNPIANTTVHMNQVWIEGGPCPANATSYDSQRTNADGLVTFGIARNADAILLTLVSDRAASRDPIAVSPKSLGKEPLRVVIPMARP